MSIRVGDRLLKARFIIDCRGASKKRSKIKVKTALQKYYKVDPIPRETVFIIMNGLDFYLWLIPKGEYLIVGALKDHIHKLETLAPKVLSMLGYDIRLDRSNAVTRGHLITILDDTRNLEVTGSRILKAGEAAGFITRNWGEGIYSALVSGELAAIHYNDPDGYDDAIRSKLIPFLRDKINRARVFYNI